MTPKALHNCLLRLHQAERRYAMARGLSLLLVLLVLLLLISFGLDRLLLLPGWGRILLSLAVLGGLAAGLWWGLLRHLQSFDPLRTALRLEARHPELESLFVSGWQFAEGEHDGNGHPALIKAVIAAAEKEAARFDSARLVSFARLRPLFAGAAAAALTLAVWLALSPGSFGILLVRLANPFSEFGYPSRVQFEQLSGDLLLSVGESAELAATVSGEIPERGVLWLRAAGGAWEAIDLPRQGADRFVYQMQAVRRDLEYRLQIADARSPGMVVDVVQPPQVVAATVELDYPDYTGLADETVDDLNLRVPEGTRLRWRLQVEREVTAPRLARDGAEPLPASQVEGTTVVFDSIAHASGAYRLVYSWELGERRFDQEGTQHFLRVLPDQPPTVNLLAPTGDRKGTLAKQAQISYRADDDHGLGGLWLIYSLNGGEEQRKALPDPAGEASLQRELTWPLQEDIPDLRVGDLITWSIEAADGRVLDEPAPQTGRSRSRRIQIVDDATYLRDMQQATRRQMARLFPLYEHSIEAGASLHDMLEEQ